MKKVLALVLAGVMAASMSVVSFAFNKDGDADKLMIGGLYTYNDDDVMVKDTSYPDLSANTTYYIAVKDADGEIEKLSELDGYKLRSSVSTGKVYLSSNPAFVIKKDDGVKKAYITFTTADKFQMEEQDLEMDIKLYAKDGYVIVVDASTEENPNATKELADITLTIDATVAYNREAFEVGALSDVTDNPVCTFDEDCDEYEIIFDDDETATFVVPGAQTKDLFLRLDTDVPEVLEDKFPNADITAVLFAGNNKTFKKTGELTIPADSVDGKAPFIYNYEDGKLTVCEDAKYDDGKEEFTIKTNKLGNYIISDKELVAADGEGETGTDAETNPDTGANDFVGLAVALAVVSVAGIAVAKRK